MPAAVAAFRGQSLNSPPARTTGRGDHGRSPEERRIVARARGSEMVANVATVGTPPDGTRRPSQLPVWLPIAGRAGAAGAAIGVLGCRWPAGALALSIVLGAGLAALASSTVHRRRTVGDTDEMARLRFAHRLTRALEPTAKEADVVDVVRRAATEVAPGAATEVILVSDDGRGRMEPVAPVDMVDDAFHCPVLNASECPAVDTGRAQAFAGGRGLDACPHLRSRPVQGAVACIPMTVGGRSVGVLHAIDPASRLDAGAIACLDEVMVRAGARLGLLRTVAHATVQAETDALTGTSNRRALDARVHALIEEQVSFAIAIADLDDFKAVNDEHGHETGDRTLQVFADAMRRTLRPDDVVARFGGDEFVMVFAHCTAHQAARVIERVRAELARGLAQSGLPEMSASFGVADSDVGKTLSAILGIADSALLEAKRSGRDRVQMAGAEIDLVAGGAEVIRIDGIV